MMFKKVEKTKSLKRKIYNFRDSWKDENLAKGSLNYAK